MIDIDRSVAEITGRIHEFAANGMRLCATSSFQTQSIPLLHMLSLSQSSVPVFFINTGYHFPETLRYRDVLAERLKLDVRDLTPAVPKSEQRNAKGQLLYITDPDRCCYYNKTSPLAEVLAVFDVWISGVRRDQTEVRQTMKKEEPGINGVMRYHPLLDWDAEAVESYIERYGLPRHPLAPHVTGMSIGCEPCTDLAQAARNARWSGLRKTECGLHTDLRHGGD